MFSCAKLGAKAIRRVYVWHKEAPRRVYFDQKSRGRLKFVKYNNYFLIIDHYQLIEDWTFETRYWAYYFRPVL